MKKYELVLLIDSQKGRDQAKEAVVEVEKLLSSLKGKVEETTDWGEKELAYKIKKAANAFFFLVQFSINPTKLPDLEKKLRLMENIIRYLIVVQAKSNKEKG
ncbi:30S ribosomal protein S6 [Patescibacteria group bacterium]